MTNIPTLKQLRDGLIADFQADFGVVINPTGNSFLMAFASVMAAFMWSYYKAVGLVQKNIWFDTADSVTNGGTLERFGFIILGRYPYPATPGQYTVYVSGTTGAVIPASAVFAAAPTSLSPGKLFQIKNGPYTLVSGTNTITVIALEGGTASKLNVNDVLNATAPIANVQSSVTVATEAVTPVDAEDTETYRGKIKEKVQLQPGGWSAVDYRLVGANITGVGQTYAYATSGQTAQVDVFLQGTSPVAYPGPSVSTPIINNYKAALELVRPLGVWKVNYYACPINNIDVTIHMGTFASFSTAQMNAITAALREFVNGVTPFIAATDAVSDRNDTIATYNLNAVISQAVPGYGFASVTFQANSVNMALWQADKGNIPFFNTVSFQP